MNKNKKVFYIIAFVVLLLNTSTNVQFANAYETQHPYNIIKNIDSSFKSDLMKIITTINSPFLYNTESNITEIDSNKIYQNFTDATNKFIQGNTAVSYKAFYQVLNSLENKDFLYINFAHKMTSLGFFSLATNSLNFISDDEIWNIQINLIKENYIPKFTLSYDEEIYLAELYSDIYFHNLAFEVIKDLSKKEDLLKKSDYANYILSLAFFEMKDYKHSLHAINKALDINPQNLNYIKNKAQILCEMKDYKQAVKLLEDLDFSTNKRFLNENDLIALKYYILAKQNKKDYVSKYYLANYFLLKKDYNRAIKTLNQVLLTQKKYYPAMTLLAKTYYKTDNISKAKEYYNKSFKLNKKYPDTLIGLGMLELKELNNANALTYFSKVLKKDKNNELAKLYLAYTKNKLHQKEEAEKICKEILSNNPYSYEAYYVLSLVDANNTVYYLKKTTSINPLFVDAWLDLAFISIKENNLKLANNYLLPVKYIDADNEKVSYYQGLIDKQQKEMENNLIEFQKSSSINPNFEPSLREVNNDI